MTTRLCPNCGAAVPLDTRFCGYCAHSLSPLSETPTIANLAPSGPVAPHVTPATYPLTQQPPRRNWWKVWLIGTISITLVGIIAYMTIPGFIVSHPGLFGSGGNSTSSAHFTRCALGREYVPESGRIDEITDTRISMGALNNNWALTLVCWVPSSAYLTDVTDQLTGPDGPTSDIDVASFPAGDDVHGVYYHRHPGFFPGSYSWVVSYANQPEITLNFEITS
ncbi:MAG TPA: zinc ribbon domain-containing protein [Ktedonobacterales bacterium]|nr:zinc ribbon domain-containing protein [Ktedonobacterales bacterium]